MSWLAAANVYSLPRWEVDGHWVADAAREISIGIIALSLAFATTTQSQTRRSTSPFTQKNVEPKPTRFPLKIPKSGPATLQLEILLDRAGFSPGIIDGTWGINATKAMNWFRVANGMDSVNGSIDQGTYEKLASAGQTSPVITSYQVTADDIRGPFVKIPDNVYQK